MEIVVVKVGGSLLDYSALAPGLRQVLDRHRNAHQVVVVGGGSLVDQVRQWHAQRPLDEETAHWMCIDLLSVTTRLVGTRLPDLTLVEDENLLPTRLGSPGITLFSPAGWLRETEPALPGTPLAACWEVTSDAIAGRLAIAIGASRLTLLKSTPPPGSPDDLAPLAVAGYIDPALAKMSAELPEVELINLRALR